MTYRLSIPIDPDTCFEVEESEIEGVLAFWQRMGGSRQWLISAITGSVARSEHGEAAGNVVRVLNGTVIEDAESTQTPSSAGMPPASPESGATSATSPNPEPASSIQTVRHSEDTGPADPWASDRSDYPGEAAIARSALTGSGPANDDPWGSSTPASGTQAPQRPAQGRAGGTQGSGVRMIRDSFDREWTLNIPGAPACTCGKPAAKVKAKSRAGRWFTTYKCAKGAGENWRDKCEFSVFPD